MKDERSEIEIDNEDLEKLKKHLEEGDAIIMGGRGRGRSFLASLIQAHEDKEGKGHEEFSNFKYIGGSIMDYFNIPPAELERLKEIEEFNSFLASINMSYEEYVRAMSSSNHPENPSTHIPHELLGEVYKKEKYQPKNKKWYNRFKG